MKVLTGSHAIFAALCAASGKWGLLISFAIGYGSHDWTDESAATLRRMVPWLSLDDFSKAIWEGGAVVLCDSQEEVEDLLGQTHGDDGPCLLTDGRGPCRLAKYHVYGLTCDPSGRFQNENT